MSTHRPYANIQELPTLIHDTLENHDAPLSVRELHRILAQDYIVDFGLVVAVVLHQLRKGHLHTYTPRSQACSKTDLNACPAVIG